MQVELQADCLAGVWANRENESLKSQGKPPFIEPGDVEAALRTAAAIGDDTLQRTAQGYVVPDSFTHGSAEQRQRWFNTGFRSGTVAKLQYVRVGAAVRARPWERNALRCDVAVSLRRLLEWPVLPPHKRRESRHAARA